MAWWLSRLRNFAWLLFRACTALQYIIQHHHNYEDYHGLSMRGGGIRSMEFGKGPEIKFRKETKIFVWNVKNVTTTTWSNFCGPQIAHISCVWNIMTIIGSAKAKYLEGTFIYPPPLHVINRANKTLSSILKTFAFTFKIFHFPSKCKE